MMPVTARRLAAVLIAAILLASGCVVWLDRPVAGWVRTLPADWRPPLRWITDLGESSLYLIGGPVVILLALAAIPLIRTPRPRQRLIAAIRLVAWVTVAIAVSSAVSHLLKFLIARPRPQIYFENGMFWPAFLEANPYWTSMPSGHTVTAFALATAIGLIWPLSRHVLVPLAVMIMVSRILLGFHWVSDTLIGAWIGWAFPIALSRLAKRFDLPIQTLPDRQNRHPTQAGTQQRKS